MIEQMLLIKRGEAGFAAGGVVAASAAPALLVRNVLRFTTSV
jgi:hypothetical protein